MTRYTKADLMRMRREIRAGLWGDAWVTLENGAQMFIRKAEMPLWRPTDHVTLTPRIGTPITVAIDAVVSVRH